MIFGHFQFCGKLFKLLKACLKAATISIMCPMFQNLRESPDPRDISNAGAPQGPKIGPRLQKISQDCRLGGVLRPPLGPTKRLSGTPAQTSRDAYAGPQPRPPLGPTKRLSAAPGPGPRDAHAGPQPRSPLGPTKRLSGTPAQTSRDVYAGPQPPSPGPP